MKDELEAILKPKKNKGRNGARKRPLKILKIAGSVVAVLFIAVCLWVLYLAKTVPSIQEIGSQQISQSTKIYDRTGNVLLYDINNGQRRTLVSWSDVPQGMKDATIAIEDKNFYNEPAFDVGGILRALWVDVLTHSFAEGGSTITQQLARTAFLTLHRTISRKIRELILAVKLNEYYSKDQILALYLNEAPYGSNISGIGEASEEYFGIPVSQLDLAQSAVLAALPQAPTYYSPWGTHVNELLQRQRLVLQQMEQQGMITPAAFTAAENEKIVFQPPAAGGIRAPHFVMAVVNQLVQQYGENEVDNGGLKVITTLNWPMEQEAEAAVVAGVARDKNLYAATNGALVAEDPTTGQILALVGSVNYFDAANDGNFDVATQALRQPGSSLKPFVYLTGFQMGYTPDTILFDVPTEFSTNQNCPAVPDYNSADKNCFHPVDFEGTFAGPMTVRDALAQSVNIPAVKMLYLVGEKNAIQNMTNFGITTLGDPSQYGLSLVLGGGAVKLIDLTQAYSVLASGGVKHAQSMILSVTDANGNVLQSWSDQAAQVADAQSVNLINDVLSDPTARAPLMGASENLTVFPGYDVALKTGTSNDYRDAWAMGYSPSLAVGVWAGNNNNAPMQRNGFSVLAAVPMWSAFMSQALPEVPNMTFAQPAPIPPTKPVLDGQYVINGQVHSILYYVDKNNPTGPDPTTPSMDPQYNNWEAGVENWAKANGYPNG